ncbi:MAG: ABC transporter ATP-binding protein SaoA [Paeniclostridium sordellii]|uniref:ABC transporter ATP-binding protein n=1 Tax=Paeniclostridium hominis TaxID=2764329 RepID=A0ABR7K414_9FIRM|nr:MULTISPECIES: ABC transporter ATP-binding protein SaoA [Paeniclostridium]MBC6003853.1 ABC transporter ATP-binding protein [Paeniclostridium hominis]MDU2591971.1 ABC transporter ATP-binding protein SaoA [Paeniclostridium sordellii]
MKLKIENVNKTFMNNKVENKVLENINLDIKEGEFVSLLGPSGCGKTTLLTIIGGFQSCEEGQVLLNNKVVDRPGIDRAFVFQNYALFPWKTVKANVEFPMKQQKLSKEEREKKLEELLEISDLKGKEKMYPHQLSGGMKQRVAVIRALACNPEVLLMDEPLGAVDFQMRQNLQEQLENIWIKNKITAIMVTHDVDEAVYMSDRVVVMSRDKGRIIEDLKIDLGRPRDRESDEYLEYKNRLTKQLSKCYGV